MTAEEYRGLYGAGPVSRPTSELLEYANLLELILRHVGDGCPVDSLRNIVAPHWADLLERMEAVG